MKSQFSDGPPPAAPPMYSISEPTNMPRRSYVVMPEILTTVVPLGPQSTRMTCPHCRAEISTTTSSVPGIIAYVLGAAICLVGCFCGCCLIPCCVERCQDVHHTCPSCKAFLGRYRR